MLIRVLDDRGLQAAVELGLIEEGEDAKALAEAINGDQNDEQERAKLARLRTLNSSCTNVPSADSVRQSIS